MSNTTQKQNIENISCRYCNETIEIVDGVVVSNCGHFAGKVEGGISWRMFPKPEHRIEKVVSEEVPCRYCDETIEIVDGVIVSNCGHFVGKIEGGTSWRMFPKPEHRIEKTEYPITMNLLVEAVEERDNRIAQLEKELRETAERLDRSERSFKRLVLETASEVFDLEESLCEEAARVRDLEERAKHSRRLACEIIKTLPNL
jgi:hypothetical protein